MSRAELDKEIRARLEKSMARLGTDRVELYYQHRVPDSIPVEDVAAVMGDLIAEGKILGWGQSQATEAQIRRAHAVTPLTAIQSEYSLMDHPSLASGTRLLSNPKVGDAKPYRREF